VRHLPIYVGLVVIPLLGVLVLLHYGSRLTPVQSVGARWHLEHEAEVGRRRLERLLSDDPALVIVQSGPRLDVQPADPRQPHGEGRLTGDVVHADGEDDKGRRWTLDARLDPSAQVLTGSWSFLDGNPVTVEFVAQRDSAARDTDGGVH
jgi:hypothetical protein